MKETNKKTRTTRQKNLILEALRGLITHPTADELFSIVRKELPNISLGTVYRNLEILSKDGSIRKLEMAGSQMRFDGRADNHIHLRCHKCGAVSDLHEIAMPKFEEFIPSDCDYEIHDYVLEFSGLCPKCKNN
jgi:Fur family transcriptional regulator, peroxide stress response regulator